MANDNELAPGGWAGKGYVPNMYVKYKINLQEFNEMYQAQGGRCAGCQGQFAQGAYLQAHGDSLL